MGGPREIAAALQADQYHVLHLSAHGSASGVELEDEDGNPVAVSASALVGQLRAGGRPLPLIVLSSCAGGAGGSSGLAATLVRHGADRVVAMQASVSDMYATTLARRFYEILATRPGASVAAALADARRELEEQRQAAARSGGSRLAPEYGVATVLAADGDPPVVNPAAAPARFARATQLRSGGGVRRLPIGYLIGRRRQLRTATAALRGGQAALDRFGALSGVLLSGVGGIGKTALAGRIETRLAGEGWLPAVHFGRWDPSVLIAAVADALADDPDSDRWIADARVLLASAEIDDAAKLQQVCGLLQRTRLLLVFDDFEQNLELGDATIAFSDPGFAEVFDTLCRAADVGRLLVTSRYPLPDADAFLLEVPVPALSPAELRRLLLRLPALRELDAADRRVLSETIGGHPRLLEFVNALLRGGRGNLKEVTVKLRDLADQRVSLGGQRPLEQAIPDAVLLGSRDILLEQLIELLSEEERELLLQAAVSRLPQSLGDLAVARWGPNANREPQTAVAGAAERLLDLTLLSASDGDQVVVHPWIADSLAGHQGGEEEVRHRRAAAMRLARLQAGRADFGDLVEVCRHHAASHQINELIAFASVAADAIGAQLGQVSLTAFLGEVVPLVPTDVEGFLPLADRETRALLAIGSVTAASTRANAILAAARQRAEADPSDAGAQRDLSVSYNKLGDLMRALGDTKQAERFYRDSLAIAERLAQADPSDAGAQRDLSVSYNKLGDLMRALGDTKQAERFYRDDLAIAERLAAGDPSDAGAQRDLSVSYERLGDLMRALGDTKQAERFYRDSLAIRERLAQADPSDAGAQRDLSVSYERLGDLMRALGDAKQAERHYRDQLAIAERAFGSDSSEAESIREKLRATDSDDT